jgi:hypothetical protein
MLPGHVLPLPFVLTDDNTRGDCHGNGSNGGRGIPDRSPIHDAASTIRFSNSSATPTTTDSEKRSLML